MLIIQPIGGLCNRMRAINSAYMLANDRNEKLTVIWFNNKELGCPFQTLFKANDNLKIIPINSKYNIIKMFLQMTCQFINNETIVKNKTDGLLNETFRKSLKKRVYIATEEHFYPNHNYDLFIPADEIQTQINKFRSKLGKHSVGVHVRRTDNSVSMAKSSTKCFIDSMKRELEQNEQTIFYLATDDLNEEETLRNAFPGKIISNETKDLSRDSVSGIKDAMIDLYSLASTTKIIGSYFSSFTDIAADMNNIPKIIAGELNN